MINQIKGFLLWVGGIFIIILSIFLKGSKSGKNQVKNEQNETTLRNAERAKKISNYVSNLDNDELNNELRKFSIKE